MDIKNYKTINLCFENKIYFLIFIKIIRKDFKPITKRKTYIYLKYRKLLDNTFLGYL
tara:strand:- start:4996 stop:5166 length:171 start_codon:yes stop_codon:yes gene_type:complete